MLQFICIEFFIKMESRAETAVKLEIYSFTRKLALDLQTGTIRKMQLYLAYWREQEDAPLTNPFKKHPALSGLLAYAMENKKIITVFCSSKPDELLTGYVETYDNKKIKLNCVDMETACIYETATLFKEDIFYLEVDSLDNELLKYANEKIER